MDVTKIRNFSIIAHIDHGKSTLADRMLEQTHTVSDRDMKDQFLDTMDIERERGITIKLNNARMFCKGSDGVQYQLNLIDTPGHVDFTNEVSRSLSACEGVLLVVDATQGVEAQTIANANNAIELGMVIIPLINKIDMASADIDMVKEELLEVLDIDPDNCIAVSAKDGIGVGDVMQAIIDRIPPPEDNKKPLQALIFDSYFDEYRGVIAQVRVKEGELTKGMRIKMMNTGGDFEVLELGVKTPAMLPSEKLGTGEVGYVIANVKDIRSAHAGETITSLENPASEPLPGYKAIKSMVFCGLYPIDSKDYGRLRDALEKMKLSDAALDFEPETSNALGFGFRCGFLGLLHMEIIQERLEREFDLNLIATAPSVEFEVIKTSGEAILVENPAKLPEAGMIDHYKEPFVEGFIVVPSDYTGAIMKLCQDRRGIYKTMEYIDRNRVELFYELPLVEIITDFFNRLKSCSQGYASLDYEFLGFRKSDLVKLDVLLNDEPVDALSSIVHRDKAYVRGRKLCEKLKELIPRHMFAIPIQAAIGSKVIARETIRAMRKDVTAKCYGGDITRKRKLLEKQKEGKKRMKAVGSVDVPQEAFLAMLKVEE
jgi:GTP-binding protein LepA